MLGGNPQIETDAVRPKIARLLAAFTIVTCLSLASSAIANSECRVTCSDGCDVSYGAGFCTLSECETTCADGFGSCTAGSTVVTCTEKGVTLFSGACCNFDGSCSETRGLECQGKGDTFHKGEICADFVCETIPTVSEWGLVVMTLLGCTLGTMLYGRRRVARA